MGRQIDARNHTGAIELLQDFQEGQSRLDRNFKDFVVRLNRHSVQAEQPCLCSKRPSLTRDQIVAGIHDTAIDQPMAEPRTVQRPKSLIEPRPQTSAKGVQLIIVMIYVNALSTVSGILERRHLETASPKGLVIGRNSRHLTELVLNSDY